MRIIEVGDDKYQVIKEIRSNDDQFLSRLTELYKNRYNDFHLLRGNANLICRKIDDIEYEEIKPCVDTIEE